MSTNTIKGPMTREEERIEEQKAKENASRKERDAVAEFQEEEMALERSGSCEVTTTATGKMIRRHNTHRANHAHPHKNFLQQAFYEGLFGRVDRFTRDLITLAASALMPSGEKDEKTISGQYNKKVNPRTALQPQYEDRDYIYDAMYVSQPAYDKLIQESEIIAAKVEEMESLQDLRARGEMGKTVEKLAEQFEMRIHPLTGIYVHDFNRVLREEKAFNGAHAHTADQRICIYLLKAELGDLRGIKAKIGDPYNQDPVEAIATGDHLKGSAPAPRPH